MTRHLGNIVSIEEALQNYSADAIRLFFLSSHYRSPLTWGDESVRAAERGAERLRAALKDYSLSPETNPGGALGQQAEAARRAFIEFMDDDFDTPKAIARIYDLARAINQARDSDVPAESLAYGQGILKELTDVLGLTMKGLEAPTEVEPFVALLVDVRNGLREAKQWALADGIRDGLAELGVILEDGPEGTTWKYTSRQSAM
jgi:cysteinyl-tRNA synthetase